VDTDDRKKVHVIDSVVTLCPRQAPVELADAVDVRPAPWSSLVCEPSVFQKLPTALGSLLKSDPVRFHFLRGHEVLLELRPAEIKRATKLLPPPWKSIEGDSLGLAVLLACWASHRKPLFRHLILTGAVEGGRIKSVGSVTEKFQGACDYADDLDQECFFLVPEASQEARRLPSLTPRILVELIPTWDECFALIPKLLTDGFDGYRHRVATTPGAWPGIQVDDDAPDEFGSWRSTDQVEIQDLIDRLLAKDPPRFDQVTLPFGNEPAAVARYVVGVLCTAIRDGASRGHHFAGETFVPIVVPIDHVEPSDGRALETAGIAGLRAWMNAGVSTVGGAADEHLRKAIRSFPQMLLLVLYGRESRRPPPFEQEKARVERLPFEQEKARVERLLEPLKHEPGPRPRIVLIASDEHHRHLLEPWLRSFAGAESPEAADNSTTG
jgi:hypothetical protein